jgi:D-3-phosphoglycerate dehydrogenase
MRTFWFGDSCQAALRGIGDLVLNPKDEILQPSELAELGRGCSVMVLDRLTPVTAELLALMPDLVAVVRGGVDYRHLNVIAASEVGVLATQVNAAYRASVAEMVLALMLSASRSITPYVNQYQAGQVPRPRPGQQVSGATVGLIGYGRIARHLAPILTAMGAVVIASDPIAEIAMPVERVTLKALLGRADYVVPLVVVNDSTRNLINETTLRQMKPTAWLINCSRGDVIEEAALERALDEKWIAGAAMDVGLATDQMPSPHLARRSDVLATPHVGGITRESFEAQAMQTVEQTAEILQGRIPFGALNAEHATRIARLRDRWAP